MRHTPWKKSRTYGDNYGGAKGHRDEDNIRTRLHSFHDPSPFDELPIMRVDNPSRDWFHPLNTEQVKYALMALPNHDGDDTTHVWLRRYADTGHGIADSIWGRGVSLITLYAAPSSLIRDHGSQKPYVRCQRIYQRYGAKLRRVGKTWQTVWTLPKLRRFYLYEGLYYCAAFHSAYLWREDSSNLQKARDQRMEDWLYRRKDLAESVYRDLFE